MSNPIFIPALIIGTPVAPTSTTVIAGSVSFNYTLIDADYTVSDTDVVVETTQGVSITLPTSVGITGRNYFIKNSGSNTAKIYGDGSELIDGSGELDLLPSAVARITSNGVGWILV